MLKLRMGILLKLVMMLCVVAQMVISLPHHHHDTSNAVCINPFHCVAMVQDHSSERHDNAGCSHDSDHRHDTNTDNCSVSHVDIVLPAREQNEIADVQPLDIMHGIFCNCGLPTGRGGLMYAETVSHIDLVQNPGAVPLHITYITRAVPARAPSV